MAGGLASRDVKPSVRFSGARRVSAVGQSVNTRTQAALVDDGGNVESSE
jgi:hypothetical protein